MIDYFAIALTHGLIALAAWRLMARDDLDDEAAANPWVKPPKALKPWLRNRPEGGGQANGDA